MRAHAGIPVRAAAARTAGRTRTLGIDARFFAGANVLLMLSFGHAHKRAIDFEQLQTQGW